MDIPVLAVVADLLFSRTKVNHPPSSSGCFLKIVSLQLAHPAI